MPPSPALPPCDSGQSCGPTGAAAKDMWIAAAVSTTASIQSPNGHRDGEDALAPWPRPRVGRGASVKDCPSSSRPERENFAASPPGGKEFLRPIARLSSAAGALYPAAADAISPKSIE